MSKDLRVKKLKECTQNLSIFLKYKINIEDEICLNPFDHLNYFQIVKKPLKFLKRGM